MSKKDSTLEYRVVDLKELKRCTISGVVDYERNFYKDGKYPYVTFVEKFRAKYSIPVAELRSFLNEIKEKNKFVTREVIR